jgi:hypothetical protein
VGGLERREGPESAYRRRGHARRQPNDDEGASDDGRRQPGRRRRHVFRNLTPGKQPPRDLPHNSAELWTFSTGAPSTGDVYSMRMARVNITIPDELLEHARTAGLNVSRLAAAALAEELDRRAKVAALDAYLAEMDAEFGPVPDAELREAAAWADGLVAGRPMTKRAGGGTRQARSA